MSTVHRIRYQCTIPAHLTRTPQQALDKTVKAAAEYLVAMAGPKAYERSIKPIYEERVTKLGTVWDVCVVLFYKHHGPLPKSIAALKEFAELQRVIRSGKGN